MCHSRLTPQSTSLRRLTKSSRAMRPARSFTTAPSDRTAPRGCLGCRERERGLGKLTLTRVKRERRCRLVAYILSVAEGCRKALGYGNSPLSPIRRQCHAGRQAALHLGGWPSLCHPQRRTECSVAKGFTTATTDRIAERLGWARR
jgi:hypothetical protein